MDYDEKLAQLQKEAIEEGFISEAALCTEEDNDNWCRKKYVSLIEAATLSIGIRPRYSVYNREFIFAHPSPLFKEAKKTLEILYRQYYSDSIFWDLPQEETMENIVQYSRQSMIALPSELVKKYDAYIRDKNNYNQKISEAKPNNKVYNLEQECKTLKQILFVLAEKHYDYSPKKQRNKAAGNKNDSIVVLAQNKGIKITDDTLRKYLKKGHALLTEGKKITPR